MLLPQVHLRPLTPADYDDAIPLYLEATQFNPFTCVHLTPDFALSSFLDPNNVWLVGESDGKYIGIVGLERIRWVDQSCEVAVAIKPQYRRGGYGTALSKAAMEYGASKLNIRRATSILTVDAHSIGILKAVGFKLEGTLRSVRFKNGELLDAQVWGCLRNE